MKLEELLEIVDTEIEFELYKGDRIGIFCKKDKGLEEYYQSFVWNINVEDGKMVIGLSY